ncbi:DUF4174 domain-containing protein [Hymenobacter daeguensis]
MKPLLPLAALLLLSLLTLTAQTPKPMPLEQTLRESRWKKRVLLVAAPDGDYIDVKTQKALLATKQTELAERDFLVLEVLYDHLSATDQQFLTRKLGVQPPKFAAILIGKDGGVKEKSSVPILPDDLFRTVDKMPMRREEMRKKF